MNWIRNMPAALTSGGNADGLHNHARRLGLHTRRNLGQNNRFFIDGDESLAWGLTNTTKGDGTATYGASPLGAKSMTIIPNNGQTSGIARLGIASTDIRYAELWFAYYLPAAADVNTMSLLLTSNTTTNPYQSAYSVYTNHLPVTADMWHLVPFCYDNTKASASGQGGVGASFDPSAVIGVQVRPYLTGDGTKHAVFGGLLIGHSTATKARIAFRFDDGFERHATHAAPYLAAHGFAGLFGICGDFIDRGLANYATWAQLRELPLMGHVVANHTYTHAVDLADWQGMTDAERVDEFTRNTARMTDEGLAEHADILVIPYGWYGTQATMQALLPISSAILCGHPISRFQPYAHTNNLQGAMAAQPLDPAIQWRATTDNAILAGATVNGGDDYLTVPVLDDMVAENRFVTFNIHNIPDGASGTLITLDEFQKLVRYVRGLVDAGTAEVVTPGIPAQLE